MRALLTVLAAAGAGLARSANIARNGSDLVFTLEDGGAVVVSGGDGSPKGQVELKSAGSLVDAVELGYRIGLASAVPPPCPKLALRNLTGLETLNNLERHGIIDSVISTVAPDVTMLGRNLFQIDGAYACHFTYGKHSFDTVAKVSAAGGSQAEGSVIHCPWPNFANVGVPTKFEVDIDLVMGHEQRSLPYLPAVLNGTDERPTLVYEASGPKFSAFEDVNLTMLGSEMVQKVDFTVSDPDSPLTAVSIESASSDSNVVTVELANGVNSGQFVVTVTAQAEGTAVVTLKGTDQHEGTEHKTTVATFKVSVAAGSKASCVEYKSAGKPSGIYLLDAGGSTDPFYAYCDMDRDGGGWMLAAVIAQQSRKHALAESYFTQSYNPDTGVVGLVSGTAKEAYKQNDKWYGCFDVGANARPCKHSDPLIEKLAAGQFPGGGQYTNAFMFKCHIDGGHWQYFDEQCSWNARGPGDRPYCRFHREQWDSQSQIGSSWNHDDCGVGAHAWVEEGARASYTWHRACDMDYGTLASESEKPSTESYNLGCGHNSHGSGTGQLWIR